MCILLHLEFLAGTDMVARNLVELAQFSHGSVVAFCYLRQGVTTLDGYVSSSALTLLLLLLRLLLRVAEERWRLLW